MLRGNPASSAITTSAAGSTHQRTEACRSPSSAGTAGTAVAATTSTTTATANNKYASVYKGCSINRKNNSSSRSKYSRMSVRFSIS
jgi:hypothetical protein